MKSKTVSPCRVDAAAKRGCQIPKSLTPAPWPPTPDPFLVMSLPDLDIGVIYTHERELMPRLLETMSASGERLRMRLILVDNASSDGVEAWCDQFAETRILANDHRLGYAANLNRTLAASTARYILLMNTDMYFGRRANVSVGWWLSWTASRSAASPVAGCITPTAPTPGPRGGSPRRC